MGHDHHRDHHRDHHDHHHDHHRRSEHRRVGYQKKRLKKLGENLPPHFKGFSGSVKEIMKFPKKAKVHFVRLGESKIRKKSKFLRRSQTIPKHDWACYALFLAIFHLLQCSPNFRYSSPNMPFWTVLMGTVVL